MHEMDVLGEDGSRNRFAVGREWVLWRYDHRRERQQPRM